MTTNPAAPIDEDALLTEISRECFQRCHPIDDWGKGKHGDSDLEEECIDLLKPYLRRYVIAKPVVDVRGDPA